MTGTSSRSAIGADLDGKDGLGRKGEGAVVWRRTHGGPDVDLQFQAMTPHRSKSKEALPGPTRTLSAMPSKKEVAPRRSPGPLKEVVNVIPQLGESPARQAPVGDWWVEVPVVYGGPMKGTRRLARKARQEKARLTRERKARK